MQSKEEFESQNPGGAPDARVAELESQLKAAKDEQLRLLAEMENQRKRLARRERSSECLLAHSCVRGHGGLC